MNSDYNFWRDLLDTYQSFSQTVQILWLIIPHGFVLAVIAMVLLRPRRVGERHLAAHPDNRGTKPQYESLQASDANNLMTMELERIGERPNPLPRRLLP